MVCMLVGSFTNASRWPRNSTVACQVAAVSPQPLPVKLYDRDSRTGRYNLQRAERGRNQAVFFETRQKRRFSEMERFSPDKRIALRLCASETLAATTATANLVCYGHSMASHCPVCRTRPRPSCVGKFSHFPTDAGGRGRPETGRCASRARWCR